MTKKEIIIETVNHYSPNPQQLRSKFGISCLYNGANNTHCAVGRCMLTKYKKQGKNLGFNTNSVHYIKPINSIDDILLPKYRGHSVDFWGDLQKLHDTDGFWLDNGLSEHGEIRYKKLLEEYKD